MPDNEPYGPWATLLDERAWRQEAQRERDDARAEAARWEALARRLYALMGEEAERLFPGEFDA